MKSQELRRAWRDYECAAEKMETLAFGPDRIRVAPPTREAWSALAEVMAKWCYKIWVTDTDSYNCRTVIGGTRKSLHAYGIAVDVNWNTNPYKRHLVRRPVRFSGKATQAERAWDVKHDLADTDMLEAMIVDVRNIKTGDGSLVFTWGGNGLG